ncbi:MAG TPA: hypothetical protein VL977_06020, partial [Solirubrobacteraceae bacterium]|nr:hypothetical protein [Solirubrobacteraceae bacterium]
MSQEPLPSIGTLIRSAFDFYARNARLALLVSFPVVATVDLIVGAGLGELTASVNKKLPAADGYISLA